jgi:hypothetical protein
MKNKLSAPLLLILAVTACLSFFYTPRHVQAAASPEEYQKPAAKKTTSQQPGAVMKDRPTAGDSASAAQFAWLLFLYAMQPSTGSGGPLTFENWTEQCQLNPKQVGCPTQAQLAAHRGANGRVRILHGSALARKMVVGLKANQPGAECNAMTTGNLGGYPAPSNVVSTAQFCEEVFVNPAEKSFVTANGLTTLTGQQTYGKAHGGAITFPWSAVEVKADWVPVASFSNPTFSCPDPTNKLYTETINGTCYALVGFHISSKVLPDWVWATFEPNSSVTNPNRCDPKLYDTCFDPWGTTSSQPYGKGQTAQQSQQLQQAMSNAHLNGAFNNYFLTGVETQFVSNGNPIPLGSSFVEFNAGVPPGQASCITCHRYAYFDGKQPPSGSPEDNFGGAPSGWPNVGYACNQNQNGNCTPVVPNSTSQDFSWMLGLMPYNGAGAKAGAGADKMKPKP